MELGAMILTVVKLLAFLLITGIAIGVAVVILGLVTVAVTNFVYEVRNEISKTKGDQ